MERIFVDANVVLEIMLRRSRSEAALQALAAPDRTFVVSPLTVHLCYYFCLQAGIDFESITKFLDSFGVVPMAGKMIRLAQDRYQGKDFEDCQQAACAELGNCDAIVTLDKHFERYSGTDLPVRVL